MASKNSVQSIFFEFLKRKAFLEIGIGVQIEKFQYVPIQEAQDTIYSLLLIDLYSVFDAAVDNVFSNNRYKDEKDKSRLSILIEKGHIDDNRANYLKWYKKWRNDAAHRFRQITYSELRQATRDVEKQLLDWKLIDRSWDAFHYYQQLSPTSFQIGARIQDFPVMIYEVNFRSNPNPACSYGKTTNLSLDEYFELESKGKIPESKPDWRNRVTRF